MRDKRAYVTLKMAMSVDGAITSKPGVQEWITGEPERLYVRDLRIAHDAVMVGAGTVRVDDPQLTVRPPHDRLRPYVRVVVCETDSVPPESRVFASDSTATRRPSCSRRPVRASALRRSNPSPTCSSSATRRRTQLDLAERDAGAVRARYL